MGRNPGPALALALAFAATPLAAQSDVEALAEQLADPTGTARAVEALVAAGGAAAEPVSDVFVHGDDHTRHVAAMVLRRLGGDAQQALPSMVAALDDCSVDQALETYDVFTEVAMTQSTSLPSLQGVPHRLLARAGARDRAIRTSFIRAFMAVQMQYMPAVRAWGFLRANMLVWREGALPRLAREDLSASERAELRQILDRAPPGTETACSVNGIQATLRPGDDRFLLRLAHTIEELQKAPLDSVHARHYHLLYGDEQERLRAASGLAFDADHADVAVAALLEGLDDPSQRVVAECVTSLGVLGDAARAARPRLQELAANGSPFVAACAGAALRQLPADDDRDH